ncbi:hypothetical protein SK128_020783, partial [Halocaridina rubra]
MPMIHNFVPVSGCRGTVPNLLLSLETHNAVKKALTVKFLELFPEELSVSYLLATIYHIQ